MFLTRHKRTTNYSLYEEFHYPHVEGNTASCKKPRALLPHTNENKMKNRVIRLSRFKK